MSLHLHHKIPKNFNDNIVLKQGLLDERDGAIEGV